MKNNNVVGESLGDGSLAARRGVKTLEPVDTPQEEVGEAAVVKPQRAAAGLKNKWRSRLGAALVAQRVLMTPLRKMRMRFSMQKATATGAATSTVTEVASAAELAHVAIWQQGNETLYTEEALAERAAARTHRDVLSVLHVWWEAALRSLRSGGDARAHEVGKPNYMAMMRKIYKTVGETTGATIKRGSNLWTPHPVPLSCPLPPLPPWSLPSPTTTIHFLLTVSRRSLR